MFKLPVYFSGMPQTVFIIIIAILVFDYLLERLLDYLNYTRRSSVLPDELKSIYDEERYAKSQEYDSATSKFGLISSTFSLFIMLVMLFFDGFAFVDEVTRSYTSNPMLTTILFLGILAIASDILGIPFSLYSTFVIEEKFGFNKTTPKTYITDKIKGYFIGAILGGGLLMLFVWFYETTGELFWIYAWAASTIFMIFMTAFYSSLIIPLFNKLTPLQHGELRTVIEDYCKKVNFKLDNLFVMDGSKRSSKANAFFSGLGGKKKIVLFDTLIQKHTTEELVAVLAHEVGHYKKKHTLQGLVLSTLQTGFTLYILSLLVGNHELSLALGAKEHGFHLGLLVFGILYSPVSTILSLGMNIISRKNEYEADAFAKKTYNGEHLKEALKKLSADHLSNLRPHPAYVFFYYSHPTLLDRISAVNKI